MDYRKQFRVKPGEKVRLNKLDPAYTGKLTSEDEAKEDAEHYLKKLARQQALLYAEHKHSVLVVLQAMDAGGKDGTIRHVFSGVNPQGVDVASFKQPTAARTRARLSLARPRPSAESRPDRHFQPLALRGRAGHARPQAHRQEDLRPPLSSIFAISRRCSPNREPRSSNSSSISARKSSSLVLRNAWTTRRATGRSANPTIQSVNCGTITSTPIEDAIARDQHGDGAVVRDPRRTTSGFAISRCRRSSRTPWPISTSPSRRRRLTLRT